MTGTWQETWTAVGTVGATVVALLLGGAAEIRHWATRRRAQANQVSAWVEEVPVPAGEHCRLVAFILNASNEPVWDVTVLVDSVQRETLDDPRLDVVQRFQIGVLPPGHKERHDYGLDYMPYSASTPTPLVIAFRDNAGRWWLRDEFARLNRRGGPPGPDAWIPSWRYAHPDPAVRRGLPAAPGTPRGPRR